MYTNQKMKLVIINKQYVIINYYRSNSSLNEFKKFFYFYI